MIRDRGLTRREFHRRAGDELHRVGAGTEVLEKWKARGARKRARQDLQRRPRRCSLSPNASSQR
jgi:hypothetical protein